MKKLFLLASLLYNVFGFSQNPIEAPKGNSKITGIVLDSTAAKGVDFATIALISKATDKPIDGASADEKGAFVIEKVAEGKYKIVVSFIGYNDKTIDNVVVEKGKDVKLGVIRLASNIKLLNEVTVTAQKALIEEKVDRLVYNAENDMTSKGGDAADVLRKVPLLTVDLEGNVTLRGNSNIRVLINNKPSTIMASSVADALKQIPADMIKTVEVITAPSAKYDAEGSGGIINITTKKNNLQGYFLNVDLGGGNRSANMGVQGSLRQGKFGATLGGFGRAMFNNSSTELNQTTTFNNISSATKQLSDAKDRPIFGRYNLGMDYDIDKNQSLSGSVRYGLRNFSRTQNQATEIYTNNTLFSNQNRYIDSKDLSNSVDVNLDYIHVYKPQQELSISTQYSRTDLTNNFSSNNLKPSGEVVSRLKNINLNLNQEVTFQLDYQTPLSTNQILEFGGKGIFRKVNSDYEYLSAVNSTGEYVSDATRPKGALNYGQNIASGYTSYTLSTKNKYSFKTGLRYEYTDIEAEEEGKNPISIPAYGTLVPSINVSKSLKSGTTLKAAYNRRIQRPGLQQLNPNLNIVNSQSISQGNPTLSPELTNNLELSMSTRIKQTFINLSLFGNQTNNAISQVRRTYDSTGAIISTFENIGKQRNTGLNFFGNVYLTQKWTINGGFDVTYSQLEGQITGTDGKTAKATNSGFNSGGRLMSNLSLNNGWAVQGFGGLHGARVQLQGKMGGFVMYSMGVRKDFNNKKGSVGISAENFLTNVKMRSELITPSLTQTSVTQLYNRGIKLNLSYKFGKMGFEQKKKTKSVKNDDVKDGGGGDAGGDAGGAPQGGAQPQGQGARPQQGAPVARPQGAPAQGGAQPQGTQGQNGYPNRDFKPQNGQTPADSAQRMRQRGNGQMPSDSVQKMRQRRNGQMPTDSIQRMGQPQNSAVPTDNIKKNEQPNNGQMPTPADTLPQAKQLDTQQVPTDTLPKIEQPQDTISPVKKALDNKPVEGKKKEEPKKNEGNN